MARMRTCQGLPHQSDATHAAGTILQNLFPVWMAFWMPTAEFFPLDGNSWFYLQASFYVLSAPWMHFDGRKADVSRCRHSSQLKFENTYRVHIQYLSINPSISDSTNNNFSISDVYLFVSMLDLSNPSLPSPHPLPHLPWRHISQLGEHAIIQAWVKVQKKPCNWFWVKTLYC